MIRFLGGGPAHFNAAAGVGNGIRGGGHVQNRCFAGGGGAAGVPAVGPHGVIIRGAVGGGGVDKAQRGGVGDGGHALPAVRLVDAPPDQVALGPLDGSPLNFHARGGIGGVGHGGNRRQQAGDGVNRHVPSSLVALGIGLDGIVVALSGGGRGVDIGEGVGVRFGDLGPAGGAAAAAVDIVGVRAVHSGPGDIQPAVNVGDGDGGGEDALDGLGFGIVGRRGGVEGLNPVAVNGSVHAGLILIGGLGGAAQRGDFGVLPVPGFAVDVVSGGVGDLGPLHGNAAGAIVEAGERGRDR